MTAKERLREVIRGAGFRSTTPTPLAKQVGRKSLLFFDTSRE